MARTAIGHNFALRSGALHDSAALARAGIPTGMIFVRTRGGVSHSREEDASEADLDEGIAAFGRLARAVVEMNR